MRGARLPLRTTLSLVATIFALHVARSASAQADLSPRRSFGAWAGASFYAPGNDFLGRETNRDLFLAALRAEWLVASGRHFALATTMDAIPLAIVTRNPSYTDRVVGFATSRRGKRVALLEQTGRGPVYGAGANPLGVEIFGPRLRAVRPYISGAAGFLWFTRNTPEPEARRLNATF